MERLLIQVGRISFKKGTALIIEEYLDKFGKDNLISNYFLAQVIVQEFVSIISIWITDKRPEPPSLFIRKFIFIINQSPVDLLRVE